MTRRPELDLGARTCALQSCRDLLVRRPNEYASDWKRRRYCSVACSSRAATGRELTPLTPAPAPGWQDKAACRGTNDPWWTDSTSDVEEDRLRGLAREFCAGCVVRGSCRMQGRREKFGLFGGVLWRTELGRPAQIDLLAALEEAAS